MLLAVGVQVYGTIAAFIRRGMTPLCNPFVQDDVGGCLPLDRLTAAARACVWVLPRSLQAAPVLPRPSRRFCRHGNHGVAVLRVQGPCNVWPSVGMLMQHMTAG